MSTPKELAERHMDETETLAAQQIVEALVLTTDLSQEQIEEVVDLVFQRLGWVFEERERATCAYNRSAAESIKNVRSMVLSQLRPAA